MKLEYEKPIAVPLEKLPRDREIALLGAQYCQLLEHPIIARQVPPDRLILAKRVLPDRIVIAKLALIQLSSYSVRPVR